VYSLAICDNSSFVSTQTGCQSRCLYIFHILILNLLNEAKLRIIEIKIFESAEQVALTMPYLNRYIVMYLSYVLVVLLRLYLIPRFFCSIEKERIQ